MLPEDYGVTPELAASSAQLKLLLSLALIVAVVGGRWLIVREIRRRSEFLSDTQRWWITMIKNAATAAILFGLIALWATEISNFALSITAFVLALVIATKELLLSISGAIWRGTTLPFQIGDWVDIGDHSGEVIDETLLTTKLQEIDSHDFRYTGRTVAVPNALLLSSPVINHNFRKRFVLHDFTFVSEPWPDALAVRDALRDALLRAAQDFSEVARRYATVIEKAAGAKLLEIEPTVSLGTTEIGHLTYRCRLFCPRERAAELEQIAAETFARAIRQQRAG